jgi:hypothetical protein
VFGPLRILRYITVRTLLAAGTAALIGFVIGPWLIAHLRRLKFGQHYDDDRTGRPCEPLRQEEHADHGRPADLRVRARELIPVGGAERLGGRGPVRLCGPDRPSGSGTTT